MKFLKDKAGNKLTFKEFMHRWKIGIEGITPKQQLKTQLNSTLIMLIGIVAGFIVSLFNLKSFWWGTLILAGAFGNTIVQYIALYQRKRLLDSFGGEVRELTGVFERIDEQEQEEVILVEGKERKGMSSCGIKVEEVTK
jgi:hypothetical protein